MQPCRKSSSQSKVALDALSNLPEKIFNQIFQKLIQNLMVLTVRKALPV
jgi:hypothetical protein